MGGGVPMVICSREIHVGWSRPGRGAQQLGYWGVFRPAARATEKSGFSR